MPTDDTLQVDQKMIQQAWYHLAMFFRCMVEAAGGNESQHAPAMFSAKDAAKYLACGVSTLKRMRAEGVLEPIETDWGPRYRKEDLGDYIEKCVQLSEFGGEAEESEVPEREVVEV